MTQEQPLRQWQSRACCAGEEVGHDSPCQRNEMACGDGCCDLQAKEEDDQYARHTGQSSLEDRHVLQVADKASPTEFQCCQSDNAERCDEECIRVVAALECESACSRDNSEEASNGVAHEHPHNQNGDHPAFACSLHLRKAFERYSEYLETVGCLCRSVLASRMPTCCDHKRTHQHDVESDTGVTRSTSHSFHHYGAARRKGRSQRNLEDRGQNIGRSDTQEVIDPGREAARTRSVCCSDEVHTISAPGIKGQPTTCDAGLSGSRECDLEKNAAFEHVTLRVEGMTCSSCGRTLERSLQAIPGVANVRVNFVMATAGFSVDFSTARVEDVIRAAERATGFHCTRVTSGNQSIDLLMRATSATLLSERTIPGVIQVVILDKNTARFTYEPTVIGARTLLDTLGELSEGLAPLRVDSSVSGERKRLHDMLKKTSVAALLTVPVVVFAWGEHLVNERTRAYISIVFATFVQLIALPEFYRPAITSLIYSRTIEMDMLVVVSITAAYLYSLVAFGFRMANKPLETSEFFETSTLLITLVLFGRLIAAFARIRAVAAVSLRSLQPLTAVVIENDQERELDIRLLQLGDNFRVMPHSRIPTDGLVIDGSSVVDESMLTGESLPIPKGPGIAVIAGTVNGSGSLLIQLTRLPGENTITNIAKLVEDATNAKPKVQDLADRVASYFVPVVVIISVIVTGVWLLVSLQIRRDTPGGAISNALTYAVAVLAVSCPCVLGLAVPMVSVVAGGVAARAGIIIKSASCTEKARKVTDVVFDKTGTLTESELDVLFSEFMSADRQQAISTTKALVLGNKHPVSNAVSKYLEHENTPAVSVDEVRVIPGAGVEAIWKGSILRAGNPRWMDIAHTPNVVPLLRNGMTVLCVTKDGEPLAVFGLKTRLRPEAARTVEQLRTRNITVHIVSGDQARAVETVAQMVGIPEDNIAAHQSPADKRLYVKELMDLGKTVLFCGDGTNDAVAVAQADVGIQIGSSSDVTRSISDIVLLSGLDGILFLLDVSNSAFRRMIFNFVWSAVYNLFAILLAAGAFVRVRIPPAYAGLGELVSVLPVIIVALTLSGKKSAM